MLSEVAISEPVAIVQAAPQPPPIVPSLTDPAQALFDQEKDVDTIDLPPVSDKLHLEAQLSKQSSSHDRTDEHLNITAARRVPNPMDMGSAPDVTTQLHTLSTVDSVERSAESKLHEVAIFEERPRQLPLTFGELLDDALALGDFSSGV